MKNKKWIAAGIIGLLILLIGINVWKSRATTTFQVETTTLTEKAMKETVITPGTLTLDEEQFVYYQAEKGEIAEIFVEEGDKIAKGDELLQYDNKQLDLEERQNDLQIRSTALKLENVREQHQDIDKELEKDPDNEMLQEEHDQIKLEQQMTNLELEQANLQKESITTQLEELTVTSEVDGTVLTVNEEASSQGQMAEQSIIRIGSLDEVIVEGMISEYDTLKIAVDQEVILTSDAAPDEEWTGKVRFIGDLPEETGMEIEQQDASVQYPIRVTIDDDINLKPGFKMLMEIVTREDKVNALPINAIQQEDEANYVYIVEEGKVKRVEVKVGVVDSEYMEIKEGVTEKDQVVVHPPEEIFDGMEVTVQ